MVKFIIERPVMVSMILIGFFLLGIISYNKLPVELIPFTEMPMLVVQVGTLRDADPDYVESQAVVELESAIAGLANIEDIESYINRRQAVIYVNYRQNTDLKYAYLRLQEAISAAQKNLGDNFYASVWKIDTEQLANMFMTLQARGEGDLDQIRAIVDEKIVQKFENVDGIANVEVYGGREHSIEVLLDEDALQAHSLTPSQIASKISSGGLDRQYLGQAVDGNKEYFVNLETAYESTTNLEEVVVKEEGPILLKHIARIIDGGSDPESISRINGMESISISLIRDQQANLLELSADTKELIDRINEEVSGDGVQLAIQFNSAETIEDNIDIIKGLALIGGLLAIVVLWIFLRNLALVMIVAAAIPLSVMIAMNFFYAFDITINMLTLVGLAIAIGMLIDNSIVVLENIHRLLSRGKSLYTAVVTGTGEVGRAVFASTLTTICVFVPFIFSDNFLIQTLGWQVGVSVISTLLVSLIVAFVLIPVFTYYFLSRKKTNKIGTFESVSQNNRLMQVYTLLLKSCFRFPARTIIIGITLFFASVVICLALSVNSSDEVETDSFNLYVTMPSGTTLESADDQVIDMDSRLIDIAEIQDRMATIQEDNVTFNFKLQDDYKNIDRRTIPEIKEDIIDKLQSAFPLVNFSYQQPLSSSRYRGGGGGGMGGGRGGQSFERLLGIGTGEEKVIIRGNDFSILEIIADNVQYNINNLETIASSSLNISGEQPAIELLFDKKAMSYFNISSASMMSELSSFQGETSANAVIKKGNEEINVILKSDSEEDKTTDDLRQISIPSTTGGLVPLTQLAGLLYNTGTSSIFRTNQQKQVEVIYRFTDDVSSSNEYLESARQSVDQIVESMAIPAGVSVEAVHDETDYSEFYFLILVAIILIYMILASVFESLMTPLAMMFTLPIATIGAFWGLILTGNSVLNANALIGFLILLGVVVNNGIILIDYSRVLRKRNFRLGRALMSAGQARVRPILITAITTILAMLPLAMGKAEYVAQIGAPFAVTVIGGLIAGTLFTLILVPTVSFGLHNALNWWRNLVLQTKLIQIATLIAGVFMIYFNVDSYLWRIVNLTALLIIIPAMTYFTMTSLRRSSETIIPENEPIKIVIRNVVKVYNDFSRFVREWRKPERQAARLEREGLGSDNNITIKMIRQIPLYIFLIYFTFFYLESGFYIVLFSILFYIYTLKLFALVMNPQPVGDIKPKWGRLRRFVYKLFYWLAPALHFAWFYFLWENIALFILVGLPWYLCLFVYGTSKKLYRENINVARVAGKFARIRKAYYRFVLIIPIIGKRKIPFRAVNRISLEIESGMFGLVGPNGAGKTTLMRIICGVLERSRGKISINDIDLTEKREELQSLIGYLPQEFGTYDNMTAYQFLDYQALLKGIWDDDSRKKIVSNAIASVHLEDNRNNKIKSFSGGMKQRVGIAQTLLHLPRILVVDEPTAGLDPRERIRFRNLLSELARNRVVIFSTHIIEDVSSSCNRLAVLNKGQVQFVGSPQEMVELTRGNVWQATISEEEFDTIRNTGTVVHHMQDGDKVRVRLLDKNKPLPNAIDVVPTLEDSYLWLLGGKL